MCVWWSDRKTHFSWKLSVKEMLQLGKITEIQTSVKLEMSLHIWGSCNSCLHSAFSMGWGWDFEMFLHSGFSHLKWLFQITRGSSKLSVSCEIHFPATLEKWALSIFFVLVWDDLGKSCALIFVPLGDCRTASVSLRSELWCFSPAFVHKNILPFFPLSTE